MHTYNTHAMNTCTILHQYLHTIILQKVLKMSKIDIHTTFLPTAASPIASLTIGGYFNPGAYRKSSCSLQLPTTCYTTPSPGTTGSPDSSAHSPALPLLDMSDEKLATNFEEEEEFEEVTGTMKN